VVAALLAATFALRLVADEPGPLFLVPVVLGAWWFGRWTGLALGVAAAGLFVLARAIEPIGPQATPFRSLSFVVVGWLVGWLAEERDRLAARVRAQDRELDELHRIQEALSPTEVPARPALELGFLYVPAQDGVAGDFCLVTQGPSAETTLIALGDVAGKGLDAARRASYVRTALAAAAPFTDEPCRLLELGNAALMERGELADGFVTALCLTYRPSDGKVTWATAGHPAPLRLDDGRELAHEGRRAPPLGITREVACRAHEARLDPGEGLLLFTDGLTEARSRQLPLRVFGDERVAGIVREARGAGPVELVGRLHAAASEFAAGKLPDDLCLVALRAVR
jgi:serine phosphatase RsbU (regulator of sigma subunit)